VTDRDVQALLDRLAEPFEGERGDWEDLLEHAGLRPARAHSRRRWIFALAAAAVVVAVVALAVTSPWSGGPSVVDRAAAAILAPTQGVLYERITVHGTSGPASRVQVVDRRRGAASLPRPDHRPAAGGARRQPRQHQGPQLLHGPLVADQDGYPGILGYEGPPLSEVTGRNITTLAPFIESPPCGGRARPRSS
jgi:hypothetical protein